MLRTTIVAVALLAMPALVTAQTAGTQGAQGTQSDTSRMRGQETDMRGGTARGMRGSRARASRNLGMTDAQVRQLQRALADMGCYTARVDGLVGPRTRQAIACARRGRDVTGSDPNELLRALNLDFTVDDTRGWDALMRGSGSGGSGAGGMRNDDTGSGNDGSMRERGNREKGTGAARDHHGQHRGKSQGRNQGQGQGRDTTRTNNSGGNSSNVPRTPR